MICRTPVLLFLLLIMPAATAAQTSPLPPLSFLGFEAGAPLEAVGRQVLALGGKGLRCDRARRDRTVRECRAVVVHPAFGRPLDLWLTSMDSSSGVLTLSSPVSGVELDAWRTDLEKAFGIVNADVQGPQWMLQWVRQGRMLRLTWKIENGAKVASVSLVDGRVLDNWGRKRSEGDRKRGEGDR